MDTKITSFESLQLLPVPSFTETGDLPQGVHRASLREVLEQFAQSTLQRKIVGMRLARVHELAAATGHVKRFIVFGSFVTAKPDPNDVDVFLIMHDTFDLTQVTGGTTHFRPCCRTGALRSEHLLAAPARRPPQRGGREGVLCKLRRHSHDCE